MRRMKWLAATLLAVLPAASLAEGCPREHSANACQAGFVWDEASQSCTEQVSS